MHVRAATAADHPWVVEAAGAVLGDPFQAHSRRQFHVTDAEVLVAERAGEPVGFASWEVDGDWCEVLAIGCTERRAGAGAALMAAVEAAAAARGCRRMRVVTTDENTGAQRFYERLGYELAERIVGGVDECRRLYKPTIPAGIHDELRYERRL
jgi:ribosomal protein S18 acetylase RimI-like enzyme